MTLLIQLTDTHILPPGEVLYGSIDTALHLKKTVEEINRILPRPDAVLITGDLVDRGDETSYRHFIDLISPLEMSAYVVPGNHDDPETMARMFADTSSFPVTDTTYQYVIKNFPFNILALNTKSDGTELPELDQERLNWLKQQLDQSDKPALIALHHPPMKTGIELIDMGGEEWFQDLKTLLAGYDQVKLLICGHCHADLCGRIGNVPVYMAPATSHQLIASRGLTIAPSTVIRPAGPTLHHFINGSFLSGSNQWPENVEDERIDKKSGLSWEALKKAMMGSRS
jgi:Icc protein